MLRSRFSFAVSFPFDALETAALAFAIVMAALFLLDIGCAPDTDLYRDDPGAADDPAGAGTAAGALVDPRAGSTDVPWNLASVTVRLPAAVVVTGQPLRLRPSGQGGGGDANGISAGLGPVEPVGCVAAGACYRVPLAEALAPSQAYVVEVAPGVVREDGAAAATGVIGAFDTEADADTVPPRIVDLTMTAAGPCVALRFSTDEPVQAQVVLRADGVETAVPAGAGQTTFDLAVPLAGIAAGAHADVVVAVVDRAGNGAQASAGAVDVPQAIPALAITEVMANPAGPEPAQEYVELRNLGQDVVSLAGLRIEDSKGADVLAAVDVQPGAYALVVPSGYDPLSARDVAPRVGTVLCRVDARIGSDGLSNGGEVVRLRMPGTGDEPIVSSYGGWVDVSASSAAGKSVHRLSDDACDQATAWTAPRAPTPGWGPP